MKRLQWIWCYAAFRLYMVLPFSMSHKTLYGRLKLWLLSYAGTYAHSEDFEEFRKHVRFTS